MNSGVLLVCVLGSGSGPSLVAKNMSPGEIYKSIPANGLVSFCLSIS